MVGFLLLHNLPAMRAAALFALLLTCGAAHVHPHCSVSFTAPLDGDVVASRGSGLNIRAWVQVASPAALPLTACFVIKNVATGTATGHCLADVEWSSGRGEVDVGVGLDVGDSRYEVEVFGVPASSLADSATHLAARLGGEVVPEGSCGAGVSVYAVESWLAPWTREYTSPQPHHSTAAAVDAAFAAKRAYVEWVWRSGGGHGLLDPHTGWLTGFHTQPPLSLHGLPHLIGPLPAPVPKGDAPTPLSVIVAVFSGAGSKHRVNANVRALHASAASAGVLLSVLLCVYDDSDWSDVPWVANANAHPGFSVVVIRGRGQMKWWCVLNCVLPLCRRVPVPTGAHDTVSTVLT